MGFVLHRYVRSNVLQQHYECFTAHERNRMFWYTPAVLYRLLLPALLVEWYLSARPPNHKKHTRNYHAVVEGGRMLDT